MKKSQRTSRDPRPTRDLTDRELASTTGGNTGGTTSTSSGTSTHKLGNKIWQDDWLAPI